MGGPGEGGFGSVKGWGPERVGPLRGEPKNSLFFPSPASIRSFSLSGGSSRGILVVFEAPGPSNVHVWSSRAVV